MPLYIHSIASYIASFGFCFLLDVPRKNIIVSSFCGCVSWTLLVVLQDYGINYIFASLIGALAVGMLAEIFSVIQKTAVTCFIVIGILPLVPGFKIYKTMLYFVTDKFEKGLTEGVQAFFIAIAIAIGLIIATSIGRPVKIIINRKKLRKIDKN